MKKSKSKPQIDDDEDWELNIFSHPHNLTVYLCNTSNLISLLREDCSSSEVQNIVHIHYRDVKKVAKRLKRLGKMAEQNLSDEYFAHLNLDQ